MDLRRPTGYACAMASSDPRELIVVHHHLFKNAGTSFDALLRENFGNGWDTREFGPQGEGDFRSWIETSWNKVVFSSHTAPIVPLALEGASVLQCVFLRHPIDRIKSAYVFESTQKAETDGARFARSHSFEEYVQHRLDLPNDSQCRNFHVRRLSAYVAQSKGCVSPLERAAAAIRKISFVGIVEEFDESMRRFHDLIRPHFPEFELVHTRANVSRTLGTSQLASLRAIREELGEEIFERLVAANQDDLLLYALARRLFVQATIDVLS